MSFQLSDLVIESIIRDGFAAVRRDPTIIDDVFAQMQRLGPLMNKKFGNREVRKIKDFFVNNEIFIVQAFSQVVDNLPCISIQLIDNSEDTKLSVMDDFADDVQKIFTDPEQLASLIILSGIELEGYDSKSGTVYVADSANLDKIHTNHILVDFEGMEFQILGGIVNTPGAKQFLIQAQAEVNVIGPADVKSSINFKQYEKRSVQEQDKLLLGLHTKERLLTIYMYILVKYFIVSRKRDLINRGFQLATYSGSDFTRNIDYVEPVFSRYLTVSGMTQNDWISDKVIPIDLVDVEVLVAKDRAGNEELKRTDQTVKVDERDED